MKHFLCPLILLIMSNSCGRTANPWQKRSAEDQPETPAVQDTPPIQTNGSPDEMGSIENATITNFALISQAVNANRWNDHGANCEGKTIAILDNGFAGLARSRGKRLPADIAVEPYAANPEMDSAHGTKLAEVVWALCTGSRVYGSSRPGPKLKLYNTNGFTNLSAAVDAIVDSTVDIVLYSQVWEFGGNFNGQGFVNELVNKVTAKKKKWVNASGNYAEATWQGSINFRNNLTDVVLPHEQRYVRLSVANDHTPVKITLAWNDFGNDKSYRTKQDLDLALEDSSHKEIGQSRMVQDGIDHGNKAGYSAHAREQISIQLKKGEYFLRVTAKNRDVFNAASRLKIAASGQDIRFLDNTPEASIMIPADNPAVITVGASDVPFSSFGRTIDTNNLKPEILSPSILQFDNAMTFAGSSSAAAVIAASIALYESNCGPMTREQWVEHLAKGSFGKKDGQLPIPVFKLPGDGACL